MDDRRLRADLTELLRGGSAHVPPAQALADLPPVLRTRRLPGELRSIWEILEHMRIAQEDILRYMQDPAWVSPPWPEGYWPTEVPEVLPDAVWEATVARFLADLEAVVQIVQDPGLDLTAPIPHAREHTYLREVLLVADHNAYHLGQVVAIRRLLGAWPPGEGT